jgi:HSP20 family protein
MSLVSYYDPFKGVDLLRREIDSLFDRATHDDANTGLMSNWAPRVDIKEEADKLIIAADLPGLTREDIQVNVDHNRLVIRGERKFENKEERKGYQRIERSYGRFERTFQLPDVADTAKIAAAYKDGVLTVTLPKLEKAQPRAITVQVTE